MVSEWAAAFKSLSDSRFNESDFIELKGSFVLKIYMAFVQRSINANIDNLRSIGFDAKETVSKHAAAFDHALLVPRCAKLLKVFFERFYGDPSFGCLDMIMPDKKRTQSFFNYMADHIVKFNTITVARINTIREEVEQNLEIKTELEAEMSRQMGEKERLNIEEAEAAVEIAQVEKQNADLQLKMVRLNEDIRKNEIALQDYKKANEEKQQCIDDVKLECIKTSEDIEDMEKQVILPHERQEWEQISQEMRTLQQEIDSKQSYLNEQQEKVARTNKIRVGFESLVNRFTKDLDEVPEGLQSLEALGTTTMTNSEAQQRIDECVGQLQRTRQKCTELDAQREKLAEKGRSTVEGLQAAINCEEEILSKEEGKAVDLRNKIAGLDESKEKLLEDIERIKAQDELEQQQIKAALNYLLAQFQRYQEEVDKIVERAEEYSR